MRMRTETRNFVLAEGIEIVITPKLQTDVPWCATRRAASDRAAVRPTAKIENLPCKNRSFAKISCVQCFCSNGAKKTICF